MTFQIGGHCMSGRKLEDHVLHLFIEFWERHRRSIESTESGRLSDQNLWLVYTAAYMWGGQDSGCPRVSISDAPSLRVLRQLDWFVAAEAVYETWTEASCRTAFKAGYWDGVKAQQGLGS